MFVGVGNGRGPDGGVRPPARAAAEGERRAARHAGADRPRHRRRARTRRCAGPPRLTSSHSVH